MARKLKQKATEDRAELFAARVEAAATRCESAVRQVEVMLASASVSEFTVRVRDLKAIEMALGERVAAFGRDLTALLQSNSSHERHVSRTVRAGFEEVRRLLVSQDAALTSALREAEFWRGKAKGDDE